jgi:hypothetical protein
VALGALAAATLKVIVLGDVMTYVIVGGLQYLEEPAASITGV